METENANVTEIQEVTVIMLATQHCVVLSIIRCSSTPASKSLVALVASSND